jgi:DNA-directed RNA polymerase specialized sigma24 family protein
MDDANTGDTGWFRAVYDRHYADVARYGLRRLDGTPAAEELAQEVFPGRLAAPLGRARAPAAVAVCGGPAPAGQPLAGPAGGPA